MIIFVLRHADRLAEPADDLSAAGLERAQLLARMLEPTGPSIAFHSGTVRARRTLEPLRDRLDGALEIVAVADVAATVAAVRACPPAAVVIVVGHSNTVGPIVAGLGGGSMAPLAQGEFDRLVVLVTDSAAAVTSLTLRYGAETA